MMLFGKMPRAKCIIVVCHTVKELPARETLVSEIYFVIVRHAVHCTALLVEDDIIEANTIALRKHVQLTYRKGLVSCPAKCACHRRDFWHDELLFVNSVTVRAGSNARLQRPPCRYTDRTF